MTPAEQALIVAACERASELWAEGNELGADHWFGAATKILNGREFIDAEVSR